MACTPAPLTKPYYGPETIYLIPHAINARIFLPFWHRPECFVDNHFTKMKFFAPQLVQLDSKTDICVVGRFSQMSFAKKDPNRVQTYMGSFLIVLSQTRLDYELKDIKQWNVVTRLQEMAGFLFVNLLERKTDVLVDTETALDDFLYTLLRYIPN